MIAGFQESSPRAAWSRDVCIVPCTADSRGGHTTIGIEAINKRERRDHSQRVNFLAEDLSNQFGQ